MPKNSELNVFTDDDVVKIIDFVKGKPILWNPNDKDYKKKNTLKGMKEWVEAAGSLTNAEDRKIKGMSFTSRP